MAFERFEASKMKRLAEPAVSILKSGGFGFNQAFCMHYLGDYTHIQLFYDRENKTIGINPTYGDAKDAIKVRRITEGKSATVAARPFFGYFDIPYNKKKTESYKVFWNEAENLIEIRLKEEGNDIPF